MFCLASRKSWCVIYFLSQKTVQTILSADGGILSFFFDGECTCCHCIDSILILICNGDITYYHHWWCKLETHIQPHNGSVGLDWYSLFFIFLGEHKDCNIPIRPTFFQPIEANIHPPVLISLGHNADELIEALFIFSLVDRCTEQPRMQHLLTYYCHLYWEALSTTHCFVSI